MDVVAYSGYTGLGIDPPKSMTYFGDLKEWYGVDWQVLTAAGATVVMTGYGNPNVSQTRQAVAKGSSSSSSRERPVPPVVCGVHDGTQAEFEERYTHCDGVMEYDDDDHDFDHSSGFHVPNE